MRVQRVRSAGLLLAFLATVGGSACAPGARGGETTVPAGAGWAPQRSGTPASLRGLSAVDARTAWVSGSGGVFARTVDGGRSWRADTVAGATGLDFRDVHAVDANTAYLLGAGEGAQSRIFKTVDGGRRWTLQYTNPHPRGFFDGLAFWDADRGIAYSDPVDGRFLIVRTEDGGATWREVPPENIPPALPGEAGFAASGTGIVVHGTDRAWFGTGGGAVARVFRSADGGRSWTAASTPLGAGPSSGVFGLAFRDVRNGVAVGGDYEQPERALGNVAVTTDGGATWTPVAGDPPSGYRSGVAFVPGTRFATIVAVGTSGSDLSTDGGRSWTRIDSTAFNTVGFAPAGAGWAAGGDGRIARWIGAALLAER